MVAERNDQDLSNSEDSDDDDDSFDLIVKQLAEIKAEEEEIYQKINCLSCYKIKTVL